MPMFSQPDEMFRHSLCMVGVVDHFVGPLEVFCSAFVAHMGSSVLLLQSDLLAEVVVLGYGDGMWPGQWSQGLRAC